MPSPFSLRRGLATTVATLAAGTAVLATTSPAGAYGTMMPCQERTLRQVFAPWGDQNNYFLAPNGGFENNGSNWQLSGGAQVVTGNESFYVRNAKDTKSLRLPAGGRAESRSICTEQADRTIRFFVADPEVAGAMLKVTVRVSNPEGTASAYVSTTLSSGSFGSGWQPSQVVEIPSSYGPAGQQSLTVIFEAQGTAANWHLDDLWVDPFKSR